MIVEGVGYGATATVTCHHGYRIVGPSSVICLGDRWSNVPSCYIAGMLMQLTLNALITTKVVCFSHLLECLRSLYGKQCGQIRLLL